MIVAVHQPQYLPWLGYFDKMRKADVFCYLNDVQFKKNEWQNRNRIKTAQNWQWITVPVRYHFPEKINEVHINNGVDWMRKHLQALITNYRRAPYYSEYMPIFEEAYARKWELISELNVHLIERLKSVLDLHEKPTGESPSAGPTSTGSRSAGLIVLPVKGEISGNLDSGIQHGRRSIYC